MPRVPREAGVDIRDQASEANVGRASGGAPASSGVRRRPPAVDPASAIHQSDLAQLDARAGVGERGGRLRLPNPGPGFGHLPRLRRRQLLVFEDHARRDARGDGERRVHRARHPGVRRDGTDLRGAEEVVQRVRERPGRQGSGRGRRLRRIRRNASSVLRRQGRGGGEARQDDVHGEELPPVRRIGAGHLALRRCSWSGSADQLPPRTQGDHRDRGRPRQRIGDGRREGDLRGDQAAHSHPRRGPLGVGAGLAGRSRADRAAHRRPTRRRPPSRTSTRA